MPSPTFNRIVSKDLNWHPYRMQRRHVLKAGDFEIRLQFCNWFSGHADDHRFILSMIIGDEAGFSMSTRVNSQNVREYAPRGQQPNFDYAVLESRERLTVWVGLCGNGELIGSVFFDRRVSGPSYLQMLNEEVFCKYLKIIFATENFGLFAGRRMGHRYTAGRRMGHRHTDQWTFVIGY